MESVPEWSSKTRIGDAQSMQLKGRGLQLSAQPTWVSSASHRRRALPRATICGAPRSASRSTLADDTSRPKHLENSAPAVSANGASHIDLVQILAPPLLRGPIRWPCACSRPSTAQAPAAQAGARCNPVSLSCGRPRAQVQRCATELQPLCAEVDALVGANLRRVQRAFRAARVAPHHFAGSTGYGHGDLGRATLDQARVTETRKTILQEAASDALIHALGAMRGRQ